MSNDTTLLGPQANGFRFRRTHEKSRNGCLRCKQQRKKCDELRPSCSRCTKRSYTCRYQVHPGDGNLSEQESAQLPVPDLHIPPASPGLAMRGSASPFALSSDHLPIASPPSGGQPTPSPSFSPDEDRLVFNPHSPKPLDAIELELLAHYLTHTSQTIPFDDLDLYALSVGVPNLAFNCNVVMSSLLALAAACKCHDIAKRAPTSLDHQSLLDIQELLTLAERHHRTSLRHIQATMQTADSYDFVLANAALMVLYASASHSIRVHLAATAKRYGHRLPSEVLPQHSQWISFTRAAHTASTAVLNNVVDTPVMDTRHTSPTAAAPRSTSVLSPQDGPSEHTKRLFLPLVASTYTRAFESLRRRAEATATSLQSSDFPVCNPLHLHAALETISVLEKCASAALSTRESPASSSNTPPPPHHPVSLDTLSRVSQWVAKYMISVTSMEAPQVLRRIIMSFLNKAPAEYLVLVQSVLDSPSGEASAERWMSQDSPGSETPSLPVTHLLAMDIFAHWLVLVMLLDGVWWIGGIGQWELGQVVALMKTQNLLGLATDTGETWWPESMYLVKRELSADVQL